MSKVSKFDFVFFVALWVNLINYFKPTAGWPYFPDVIDALVPAVGALGSHVTMLAIMALKLPTEDQVRTWATLRSQKREIKKQLKDPMLDDEYKAALKQRYTLLHKTKLDSLGIEVTPADKQ